jgi:hypothetical protein
VTDIELAILTKAKQVRDRGDSPIAAVGYWMDAGFSISGPNYCFLGIGQTRSRQSDLSDTVPFGASGA